MFEALAQAGEAFEQAADVVLQHVADLAEIVGPGGQHRLQQLWVSGRLGLRGYRLDICETGCAEPGSQWKSGPGTEQEAGPGQPRLGEQGADAGECQAEPE
ncbi:hypothetical protein OH686_21880 [Pseudomonas sp. SO81]|nr:hypothetical protein OH686_21880 [Pseudomonas sp. SO81]